MTAPGQMHKTAARTWQMSFNDLLTILLTFFILLVSVSHIYVNKAQELSSAAVEAFGARREESRQSDLIGEIAAIGGIDAYRAEGGIAIVLPESFVYRSGSADILHKDALRALGGKLKAAAVSIRVEGHTDSQPVANGPFPSNWELSAQRSVNVVKFFIRECGIDPRNLSAAGYSDSRPVSSNDTPEGRGSNRRVSMIITFK